VFLYPLPCAVDLAANVMVTCPVCGSHSLLVRSTLSCSLCCLFLVAVIVLISCCVSSMVVSSRSEVVLVGHNVSRQPVFSSSSRSTVVVIVRSASLPLLTRLTPVMLPVVPGFRFPCLSVLGGHNGTVHISSSASCVVVMVPIVQSFSRRVAAY
jgi:hypothetical protein